MGIVQKRYTPHHFRGALGDEHVKRFFEDSVLAPMFDVIWEIASKDLLEKRYALLGISDARLLEREGHCNRGKWICVVDGQLVDVGPVSTDMNVISESSMYMTWGVLVEGEAQQVNAFLVKFSALVRQHVDSMTFSGMYSKAAARLRRHRADMFSRQVRDFYNLSIEL